MIGHCLGSVTLMMSLYGKAIDGLASLTVNSVALTPRVPGWSKLKLTMAPTMVEHVLGFPNLNPRWCQDPTLTRGKLFSKAISMFHRECDVPECHMLSLMWGTGWPALYSHENLADVTHRRGGDLYGATSLHYYRCVNKMVRAGSRPLKYDPSDPALSSLPDARLRLRPRDRHAGAADDRPEESRVHGLEHRLPRAAEGARRDEHRAGGVPELRAPGRVHGRARRARLPGIERSSASSAAGLRTSTINGCSMPPIAAHSCSA